MATHPAGAGSRLVLSESKWLRLFVFFIFYVGQGLPIGLTAVAIPGWLAAHGASDAAVAAMVAIAYLAWSWKFVAAALMDRFPYLPMGRRRLWLIGAQTLMLLGFVGAATVGGAPDDITAIGWLSFTVMTAAALQDVAVDGLAVDTLPVEEQGTANAWMFGGQVLGQAGGAALGGAMLQWSGPSAAFASFTPLIALLTVFSVLLYERPGERRFPWSNGETSPVNLRKHTGSFIKMAKVTARALMTVDSIGLIGASALWRIVGGAMLALYPIMATQLLGLDTIAYSNLQATILLVSSVPAMALGTAMSRWMGDRKGTIVSLVFLIAMYAFIQWGAAWWMIMWVFVAMSFYWQVGDTLTTALSSPLRMRLSDERVAATQFTIYNSLANLPVAFGATIFAWFGGLDGMFVMLPILIGFLATAVALLAVLPLKPVNQLTEAEVEGIEREPAPRLD